MTKRFAFLLLALSLPALLLAVGPVDPTNLIGSRHTGFRNTSSLVLYQYAPGENVSALGGSFTRTSPAHQTSTTGVLVQLGSGIIRDGHYVSGNRTTLLESQRTNLALQSQTYGTTWATTNGSIVSDTAETTDPFATNTADVLLGDTTSGVHRVFQNIAMAEAAHTYSVLAKYKNVQHIALRLSGTASTKYATFDIQNGTATGVEAGATQAIEALGGGWYRISMTWTVVGATNNSAAVYLANSSTYTGASFASTTSSGVYLSGAQLEAAGNASSYIGPTTAASVTRAADASPFTLGTYPNWTRWEWYYTAAGVLTETVTPGTGSYSWTPTVDRAYRKVVIAKETRDAAFFASYK